MKRHVFAVFLTLSKCKHLANLEPVKWSECIFTVALETSSPVEEVEEEKNTEMNIKKKQSGKIK